MNQKAQIARAALQLFAEHGFGNTSVSMIAKKAKVSQGLMYNFYPSKDALLSAILQEGLEDIQVTLQGYAAANSPQEALKQHIESTFSTVLAHEEYWRLFHSIRMQSGVLNILGDAFQSAQEQILRTLAYNFRKLGYPHPREEARIFFALIDGLVGQYLLDPSAMDLHKIKRTLIKKYHL